MMYGRLIVLAVLAHGQTNTAVPYSYSYNDEPTWSIIVAKQFYRDVVAPLPFPPSLNLFAG